MFKDYAKTPPMGWNSWDCFGAAVNEEQLLGNAEYMAKHLKQHGWEYIVCDIQWYEPTADSNSYHNFRDLDMDEYSRLIPAVNRFPSAAEGKGFKSIADKIHGMGLKFGIHILRGIPRQAVHRNTPIKAKGKKARDIVAQFSMCPWNVDMYGVDASKDGAQEYYNSLLELYASWGVDFIKCDDISNTEFKPHDPYSAKAEIEMLRIAIDSCGREIVLSLSPGPAPVEYAQHLKSNANMWRMTGDFWDKWDKLYDMFGRCRMWQDYVGDGGWPDCDMLPIGRLSVNAPCYGEKNRYTNFTHNEQITMMTLWCIFRSPLMMGGEMRENDEFTLSLMTNDDLIDMLKNSHGARELYRHETDGEGDIAWISEGDNCKYLAFFNTCSKDTDIDFDFTELLGCESCEAYDIWTKQSTLCKNVISSDIGAHGAVLYKITVK